MSAKRDGFLLVAYRRKVDNLLAELANRPRPETEEALARAISVLTYLEGKTAG